MHKIYIIVTLLFFIPIVCVAKQPKKLEYITGEVIQVYDGDTIKLEDGSVLRLKSIDAPESNQLCKYKNGNTYKCGVESKNFLEKVIHNRVVTCKIFYKDKYDRKVAVCKDKMEQDINYIMVRTGNALASNYNNENPYKEAEDQAKFIKIGVWQGKLNIPYQWRMKYGNKDKDEFYY